VKGIETVGKRGEGEKSLLLAERDFTWGTGGREGGGGKGTQGKKSRAKKDGTRRRVLRPKGERKKENWRSSKSVGKGFESRGKGGQPSDSMMKSHRDYQ